MSDETVRRLRGFADFVLLKNERIVREQTAIHVVSPFEVVYLSTLDEAHRDREVYARATVDKNAHFGFGEFMSCEDFVIAAMTLIEDRENRPELLQVVGTAGTENVTDARDDGITQSIGVRAGVTLQKRKEIQNPFRLAPHRTFVESTSRTRLSSCGRGRARRAPRRCSRFSIATGENGNLRPSSGFGSGSRRGSRTPECQSWPSGRDDHGRETALPQLRRRRGRGVHHNPQWPERGRRRLRTHRARSRDADADEA